MRASDRQSDRRRATAIVLVICALCIHDVRAGQAGTSENATVRDTAPTGAGATGGEAGSAPSPTHWFEVGFSSVYESNLEHDETNVRSFGFAPSLAVHFQDRASRPLVQLDYEIAPSRYTNSERFDIVSHYMTAQFEKRFGKRWSVETDGEISIHGSSEDRDVSNQYTLTQRVGYRVTSSTQIEPYVAYRIRRFPGEDVIQNAVNPQVGLRIKQRFEGGRRLVLAYRYDWNRAWSPRYKYIRRTWDAEYETPLLAENDRLTIGATYKERAYLERLVEIADDVEVPRRDFGWWALQAEWERPLANGFRLGLFYKFEIRGSNDPEKEFSAHQTGASIVYRW